VEQQRRGMGFSPENINRRKFIKFIKLKVMES
jgi:hypothetical protein